MALKSDQKRRLNMDIVQQGGYLINSVKSKLIA
jgi:hypothetical protein